MLRAGVICVGLLLVGVLAGCGGHHRAVETDQIYTLDATRSCLDQAGFQTTVLTNHYLPGSGGNLRVRVTNEGPALLAPNASHTAPPSDEFVFLVFDHDRAAALKTEARAVTLGLQSASADGLQITRNELEKGVGLSKNVFFYSATGTLTNGERRKVANCLR